MILLTFIAQFSNVIEVRDQGNPYGVATGDFNSDRRIDFAIANNGVDYITVYLSKGKRGRLDS